MQSPRMSEMLMRILDLASSRISPFGMASSCHWLPGSLVLNDNLIVQDVCDNSAAELQFLVQRCFWGANARWKFKSVSWVEREMCSRAYRMVDQDIPRQSL